MQGLDLVQTIHLMVVGMKMAPISSQGVVLLERIWTCGLVGVGMSLLEEMSHWG